MGRPKRSLAIASRDRVFAAAAAEFAARGYAGASMDRIARTAVAQVAAAPISPQDKIRQYVDAIATAAEARPHFPPIWLRELAEGGEHVDAATLEYLRDVLAVLGRIIADGRRRGVFHAVN